MTNIKFSKPQPKPSRIAFISVHGCPLARLGSRSTGGMSIYVKESAQALGRLGFKVDIYTRMDQCSSHDIVNLDENTRVIHLHAGSPNTPKEFISEYLDTFTSLLFQFQANNNLKYDLIQSHYWLSGQVAKYISGKLNIPHVTTFHTLSEIKARVRVGEVEKNSRNHTEHEIVSSADRIIASTHHELRELHRLYGAQETKIRVIPGGVDLDMFTPGNQSVARDQLNINGQATLLYVGRVEPIKGLEVLLHTIASLESSRNVNLLVIGGGGSSEPLYLKMQQLARQLVIEKNVNFLGNLDHQLLPLYYQAADICIVPSYYESFGLVALEAMACGTPVVASRVGGLTTIVQNNMSGYLIPWHCPDAFADRVEILLDNKALRDKMGENGRDIALRMSWDKTGAAISKVYSELCVTSSTTDI